MNFNIVFNWVLMSVFVICITSTQSTATLPLEITHDTFVSGDTVPDDIAERLRMMEAKRAEIRQEVARIKNEQSIQSQQRELARLKDEERKANKKANKEKNKTGNTDIVKESDAELAKRRREAELAAQKEAKRLVEAEEAERRRAELLAKKQEKERKRAEAKALKEAQAAATQTPTTRVEDEASIVKAEQLAAEKARQKALEQEEKRRLKEEKKAALQAKKEAERAAKIAASEQAEKERLAAIAAQTAATGVSSETPNFEPAKVETEYETIDSQRIKAESVNIASKKPEKVNSSPKRDETSRESEKTKKAVAKAMAKRKKKNKGLDIPTIGSTPEDKYKAGDLDIGDCSFAFNEIDPFTGRTKRKLEDRFFFSYTQEALKVYLQGEDYLTCKGSLSDIQGILALNLEFTINSPYARQEYGSIGTGTQLILRMIDGETLPLLSEQSDSGIYDKHSGKTIYKTLFLIGPKDEKILRKKEISEVRMVWGTGYEDYQINELDFMIDQFECIDAARAE